MQFIPTEIPEVIHILPEVHGDQRGYFVETYRDELFAEAGLKVDFVQDNQSLSTQGTLRGLHYQIEQAQGKLVRVVSGVVYDVAVDMRRSSATFGKWVGVELSAERMNQLWVPAGFAHGFLVLSETAEFVYKCTNYYAPQHERTIRWDDPELNIQWPLNQNDEPRLSEKDQSGCWISEAEYYP